MTQSSETSQHLETCLDAGGVWLESMYEQWQASPESVSEAWQHFFESEGLRADKDTGHQKMLEKMSASGRLSAGSLGSYSSPSGSACDAYPIEYPSRAMYLIHAWRVYGHTQAQLDPLKMNPPSPCSELELSYYGLSEADLDFEFPTGDMLGPDRLALRDILLRMQRTYAGHIGPEVMHVSNSAKKHWLFERLERLQGRPAYDTETKKRIFKQVMHADAFEHYLHTRYMGQKRFSLEGGESLIVMLNRLIQEGGKSGVKEIILGMAHRGRLNVLANVLGKSLSDIFAEFEGTQLQDEVPHGSGDVKYHLGFSSDVTTPGGVVHVSLGFNPSHLEIITPVAMGSVRARQCRRKDKTKREVMNVLVHGDAAFAGQGVVAESLELSKLRGFRIGGTIHIVVNNQIGFTVNPHDARSTTYCTDIAKVVHAPILHVNGDDPEACCLAVEIALEYRNMFLEDIVIDLICYRRHGHNEADSPEVTQPLMYRRIAEHPTVESVYRDRLICDGVLSQQDSESMVKTFRNCLEQMRRAKEQPLAKINSLQGRWSGYLRDSDEEPETAVVDVILSELAHRVHLLPAGFSLHPRIEKIYEARMQMMVGNEPVDWGCAETMAYATLVNEGGWVRLSGEDSGRGTFFHRHAVVYDQITGKSMIPLRQVENGSMSHFIVIDSMLSEMAVLGYEYGYSVAEPRALVIWEAQYGDFANMAQVVIDQFIAAGETKWNRMSGLVVWLPHGYEGQGAEHSSARLERYLQLCAEQNMQVVCPTTPAQLFHLLRRQQMSRVRKPLIMMAPKSMLRNKLSFSQLKDFTGSRFQPVLKEADAAIKPSQVRRLILCTGKVYYDLLAERGKREIKDIAMVRIERLYPFPTDQVCAQLEVYGAVEEIVWVQEEPENQGAWMALNSPIRRALLEKQKIYAISRPAAAAPAVGAAKRHKKEQAALVDAALSDKPLSGKKQERE